MFPNRSSNKSEESRLESIWEDLISSLGAKSVDLRTKELGALGEKELMRKARDIELLIAKLHLDQKLQFQRSTALGMINLSNKGFLN